ncbi:MAG TPA: glycosyltransferase, partial [Candidatus Acidoferrales bacterium]|nr:glycosyltransferase [Candidatus Acidoferrales bacterium]
RYREERERYWDEFAESSDQWQRIRGYYQQRLAEIYKHLIPPRMRVLELGCGQGDLLAALEPSRGVGIDLSEKMLERARERYPDFQFFQGDVQDALPPEKFDFIILSDLLNDVRDVQSVLELVAQCSLPSTRIVLNAYSRLWQGPRWIARMMGAGKLQLDQNWLSRKDLENLLYLTGFETIRGFSEIIWPVKTPGLDTLCNRYLVKFGLFRWMGLTNFIVARPQPKGWSGPPPSVSVVIPAPNAAGNIRRIFEETPEMGLGTELIFVEGDSTDNTYESIEEEMRRWPNRRVKVLHATGEGKADALRLGFAHADGDLLMTLDAELTVSPQDLPRFYDAWYSGKGEVVNGVRLVYPTDGALVGFARVIGYKFFSVAFSWLFGQNVKDTLCGTKALSKSDYETIAANRAYLGDFDPFGDFDLLFGAAKYSLKIVDLPIRYQRPTDGTTSIDHWKRGWLLLKMVGTAMRKIKFV